MLQSLLQHGFEKWVDVIETFARSEQFLSTFTDMQF